MDYDEIAVDKEISNVADAVQQGTYRVATKQESMTVRLAALSDIVHEMQVLVQSDTELQGNRRQTTAL